MRKNRKMNLCNTCSHEFPSCSGKDIEFGEGIGNDNIISCDAYDTDIPNYACPNCGCEVFVKNDNRLDQCCKCGQSY